jgi:hypothetical protein
MAEHDILGGGAQDARSERTIFLLLICYLAEELLRPAWSALARSFRLPATGPWLRH